MNPENPLTAIEKHSCPACGAQAEWQPSKQQLACGFCGTESPYELNRDTGQAEEIDLVSALRELPEEHRGWREQKRTVRCQSCDAVSVFDPERVGKNCEFCGSPSLVDYDEIKAPIRPQSLLPFRVDETKVRESLKSWLKGRWFAPGGLAGDALVDTLRGLYIPYWTFDAQVGCRWQAEAGTYYTVQERVRDANGRVTVRPVQKVRWRSASGHLDHFFDDELVAGTQGLDSKLLRQAEPFPTNDLVAYDTAYVSGFLVEHYRVVLIDAARKSREKMHSKLEQLCGARVPGDTYRNLRIAPEYSGETFKHILVPVWLLRYDHHGKSYQILVNGYTNKIAGHYPKSAWKIAGAVAAALLVVGVLALLR
ncbi:MAG: zinc ribbon domain-containing protein [Myxococcota bacterium]